MIQLWKFLQSSVYYTSENFQKIYACKSIASILKIETLYFSISLQVMLMEKSDKINHTFQFSMCKTRKIFEGWLGIVFSWYSHMKFWTLYREWWGFPGGSGGKKSTCQCRRYRRLGFDPWVGKILWRRKWQPTLVFLPGKFCVQRSLVGYSPWGHKESDITEQLSTRNDIIITIITHIYKMGQRMHYYP